MKTNNKNLILLLKTQKIYFKKFDKIQGLQQE